MQKGWESIILGLVKSGLQISMRHELYWQNICEESAIVDDEVGNGRANLKGIFQDYATRDIFNAEETT